MASPQTPRKTHMLRLLVTLSLGMLILPNKAEETTNSTKPDYYYNLCAPSTCNTLFLTYPFILPSLCHPSIFKPTCTDNGSLLVTSSRSILTLRIVSSNFTTDSTTTYFVAASDSLFGCGPVSRPDYTFDTTMFSHPLNYTPGTHLNCTRSIPASAIQGIQPASCLGCIGQDLTNVCYYVSGLFTYPGCETYTVFTPRGFNVSEEKDLRVYLRRGYQLMYTKPIECSGCEASGGRCGTSPSSGSHVCFCPSSVHRLNCSDGIIEDITTWARGTRGGRSKPSKAVIAAVSASASVVFLLLTTAVTFSVWRRNRKIYRKKETISNLYLTRYSYSQIKKFTNNFSSKLGEGGYGTVYKGFIHQSGVEVPVAIKLLKSEQSVKQFMNEVATVGNVHHQHLVCLLGYCAQEERRALVYEFMEKGSLDKYIYKRREGGDDNTNFELLSHKQIYAIAVETAKGIVYLHQGCRIRILHLDIKPHNVLLDSNLSAKVADFGLAKMMDKGHSHVSLPRAQGTPGYIAPEMWSKAYGPVTEKSDVYSYGMMLLEMVGRRKNCDPKADKSSQVYFPLWALDKLKVGELALQMRRGGGVSIEIQGDGDEREGNEEVVERMCLVGLWCIQHIPSNRPSMERVIQMLEGNVEIGIPPHPFPQQMTENVENNSIAHFSFGSVSESLEAR